MARIQQKRDGIGWLLRLGIYSRVLLRLGSEMMAAYDGPCIREFLSQF